MLESYEEEEVKETLPEKVKREEQERKGKLADDEMMQKYFPYYNEKTAPTGMGDITEFLDNLPEPPSVLDDAKRIKKMNFEASQ